MIVLTTEDKDWLLNFLLDYKDEMLSNGLSIEPIEFLNGWMLPEAVLYDLRCEKAKNALIAAGELSKMVVREVGQEELFGSPAARLARTIEQVTEVSESVVIEESQQEPWYKRAWNKVVSLCKQTYSWLT